VALLSADALARLIEGKALLVAVLDEVGQLIAGEGVAVGGAGGQQVGYGYPATCLQREANGLGRVAQVFAEKFAEAGSGFRFHVLNVARTFSSHGKRLKTRTKSPRHGPTFTAMQLEEHVSLRPYNTFGLDVQARYFARFASADELRQLLARPEVLAGPLLILGGGSNLLLTQNFGGVVLKNEIKGLEIISEDADTHTALLRAGAGESWHGLVEYALGEDLHGIENLSLIPGTVGAAPLQNIGAYGAELQDTFERLEALEISTGQLRVFNKEECGFGYRESVFKGPLKGQFVVTAVVLRLHRAAAQRPTNFSYGAIQDTLTDLGIDATEPTPHDVSRAVVHIRRSKLPDPAEIGNAGSFFKNPEVSQHKFDELKSRYPALPGYPVPGGVKVPAGWLIEQAGFKGLRRGAGPGTHGVHDRQALVLVNHGGATGQELHELAEEIIRAVRDLFGIELHPEVNIL
jgi:UDP-N-acetylmuramate dehydrogenase